MSGSGDIEEEKKHEGKLSQIKPIEDLIGSNYRPSEDLQAVGGEPFEYQDPNDQEDPDDSNPFMMSASWKIKWCY